MKIYRQFPRENAREYAHRVLLDNIIKIELPPGSAVSEKDIADVLGLSRTPVREALIEMNRLGLVEIIPQKGSYVTKIDYGLIEEARFVRQSVELAVIDLACEQGILAEDMELLDRNMEEEKAWGDRIDSEYHLLGLDNEFHRLLFKSVGKLQAHRFVQAQMYHFDRLRILTVRTLGTQKNMRIIKDHENILGALKKQDKEQAEQLMKEHLSRHLEEREALENARPEYFVKETEEVYDL